MEEPRAVALVEVDKTRIEKWIVKAVPVRFQLEMWTLLGTGLHDIYITFCKDSVSFCSCSENLSETKFRSSRTIKL